MEHIPYPYCYRCVFGQKYPSCKLGCLEYLSYIFDTVAHPDEVAAIFAEPIQQVAGGVSPPDDYFPRLKKICEERNILLVDDEVAAGFGRTGRMFGIEHYGVVPDVMFLGKGFANGLSMAGIVASREIMDVEARFPVIRGGSFAGNPVSCVSALAVLSEIQEKGLVGNSGKIGGMLLKRLLEMKDDFDLVGDVRGKGLLICLELVKDRITKEPATEEARKVCSESLRRGLLVGNVGTYGQVVRITPPLIVTEEEAETVSSILYDSLKAVIAQQ